MDVGIIGNHSNKVADEEAGMVVEELPKVKKNCKESKML